MSTASKLEARLELQVKTLSSLSARVLCATTAAPDEVTMLRSIRLQVRRLFENPRFQNMRKVGSGENVHYEVKRVTSASSSSGDVEEREVWEKYRGLRPTLRDRFYPFLSDDEQMRFSGNSTTVSAAQRNRAALSSLASSISSYDSSSTLRSSSSSDHDGASSDGGDSVGSTGSADYDYASGDAMDCTRPSNASPAPSPSATPPPRQKTNARFCLDTGLAHGALVHSQIQRIIDSYLHGYRSPLGSERIDPCVSSVIEVFNKRRWIPIATELMVYDETHRVATQADVVVFDLAKMTIRVIELTFGYEDADFTTPLSSNDRFEAPLAMAPNCPGARKMLQLWMTAEIMRRKYGIAKIERALLRVCPRSHLVWVYMNVGWWNETRHLKLAYDTMSTPAEPGSAAANAVEARKRAAYRQR